MSSESSAWTVRFRESGKKDLAALDPQVQRRILRFLRQRVAEHQDPRWTGKPLKSKLAGLWRYRVGDLRVICRLDDARRMVLVVAVGHRREI